MRGDWQEHVLYSFGGGSDGAGPISNVNFDSAGNLYSTTSECCASGAGVTYKLVPDGHHSWESVVHRFSGPPDGALAYNGMLEADDGTFFGATVHGGSDNDGAIYRFTP